MLTPSIKHRNIVCCNVCNVCCNCMLLCTSIQHQYIVFCYRSVLCYVLPSNNGTLCVVIIIQFHAKSFHPTPEHCILSSFSVMLCPSIQNQYPIGRFLVVKDPHQSCLFTIWPPHCPATVSSSDGMKAQHCCSKPHFSSIPHYCSIQHCNTCMLNRKATCCLL